MSNYFDNSINSAASTTDIPRLSYELEELQNHLRVLLRERDRNKMFSINQSLELYLLVATGLVIFVGILYLVQEVLGYLALLLSLVFICFIFYRRWRSRKMLNQEIEGLVSEIRYRKSLIQQNCETS